MTIATTTYAVPSPALMRTFTEGYGLPMADWLPIGEFDPATKHIAASVDGVEVESFWTYDVTAWRVADAYMAALTLHHPFAVVAVQVIDHDGDGMIEMLSH